MKKVFMSLAVVATVALTSCSTVSSPVMGLYMDVKGPIAVTSNSGSSKVGTSEATSILGIVATGDASIETAAKSAGITKIHHVDHHSVSYLGFYSKYVLTVYGE